MVVVVSPVNDWERFTPESESETASPEYSGRFSESLSTCATGTTFATIGAALTSLETTVRFEIPKAEPATAAVTVTERPERVAVTSGRASMAAVSASSVAESEPEKVTETPVPATESETASPGMSCCGTSTRAICATATTFATTLVAETGVLSILMETGVGFAVEMPKTMRLFTESNVAATFGRALARLARAFMVAEWLTWKFWVTTVPETVSATESPDSRTRGTSRDSTCWIMAAFATAWVAVNVGAAANAIAGSRVSAMMSAESVAATRFRRVAKI